MNTVIPLGVKEVEDAGELPDVMSVLAAAAGGDAKIIIYRHTAAAKLAYIETVQLAAISSQGLDYIQRKWGGGDYRLQVHGRRSDGKSGIVKAYDVTIGDIPAPAPSAAWQQTQATWNSEKVAGVVREFLPIIKWGIETWSARQPVVMQQAYANPVAANGGSLAAMSETLMSLQLVRQIKDASNDLFGDMASGDSDDKRSPMLKALAPALGMLMQPTPTPTPTPEPEQEQEEDMAERSQYETVLALIAESIRSGNQDTVIALLEECDPTVSAQILSANGMQIAMFAGRFALSVAAVRASLENAKEVLNAPKSV